jgi:hypothetical protein
MLRKVLSKVDLVSALAVYLVLINIVINVLIYSAGDVCMFSLLFSLVILASSLGFYFLFFKRRLKKIVNFQAIENLNSATTSLMGKHRILEMFTQNLVTLVDNNTGVGLWIKDEEDKYIFANQTLRMLLFRGKEMYDLASKTDGEITGRLVNYTAFEEMIKRVHYSKYPEIDSREYFEEGSICNITDIITRAQKKPCRFHEEIGELVLDVWKTPLLNEKGEVVGTVGTLIAVSNEGIIRKKKKLKELEEEGKAFKINGSSNYFLTQYSFD